jgi:hypothetical protein
MGKSNKKLTKNKEHIISKGGALKFESYPDSDAGKIKIEGVKGVQYFYALWKYFIDIYKKTGGKDKIIDKLSNDTTDILNYFNNPRNNNMLILDYNYLDYYSITLQIINKNNGDDSALTYYIIINFPQDIHLTIHFNRSYRIVKESVLARDDRAAKRASVKGDKSTSQKTNIYEFVDKKSILTPIHLTSNTKYRSYYMSIAKINKLVKSFIKVMPKEYDEETYINQIIPCVFIGGFCAELAELMSSSFIINRIGEAIEKYLNSILRGGQKINKDNLPSIISKIKEIIDGERKKANDSNAKLYISLNSDIDMLVEYHINANETITQDTITNIKSILYGIEGYKDINTFLYDTKLVRGTSVSVRSNEFKDLSRYFTNKADFDEYCDKYYKGNMQDCDKSSKSAKDVMGNVVDKINQNNIILSIGNLAATALVDTIADLIKIKEVDFSGCARIIFELSNDLFLIMKYVDGKKEIVDNVKRMSGIVIKTKRFYAKKQSIPSQLPESLHESSQESHEIPQIQQIPQIPQSQQIPLIPQIPQLPHIPQIQQIPQIPQSQQIPLIPQIPQLPHIPQLQQSPHIPQIPQISHTSYKQPSQINESYKRLEELRSLLYEKNVLAKQLNDNKNIFMRDLQSLEGIKSQLVSELYNQSNLLQKQNIYMQLSQNEMNIQIVSNNIYLVSQDIFNINQDIFGINQEILNLQGQQSGGSKVVSKVINRYLDKIKEVRAIIKNLNDNKKKNKSNILTKRMQIKNLYSKIKIQREKERQRANAKKAK